MELSHLQSLVQDLDKRLTDRFSQLGEQHKQQSERELMTVSMLNILDERVNALDTRVTSLEKVTKEVHATVQKYKAKGSNASEKLMNERVEALIAENTRFQEVMRQRMLEVGNVIDIKCKKVVTTLFESKMNKLESEIKEN